MTEIGKGDAGASGSRMFDRPQGDVFTPEGGADRRRDGEANPVTGLTSRVVSFQRQLRELTDDALDDKSRHAVPTPMQGALSPQGVAVVRETAPASSLVDLVTRVELIIERQALAVPGLAGQAQRIEMRLGVTGLSHLHLRELQVSLVGADLEVALLHAGAVPPVVLAEAARELLDLLRQRFPQRTVRLAMRAEGSEPSAETSPTWRPA